MGLFNRKQKTIEQKQEFEKDEKKYIIPYSKGWRGFKKFPVVVYGDEETENNNRILCKQDVSNCTFEFVCFNEKTIYYDGRMCLIYIDGVKVGAIYDNEQIQQIENGQIEKIHVENKTDYRFSYFVKYKE
jgi:hypothetical protein